MSTQGVNVTNKQSSFAKKNNSGKTSSLVNATNSPISAAQGSTM